MSLDLVKYQGLIFDMDGTLIDTMPEHVSSWKATAEHFDFPFDGEWLHSMGGMPSFKVVGEISRRYGLNLVAEEVTAYKQAYFAQLDSQARRIPHTCEILERYCRDKRCALGTGSKRNSALELLEKAQLLDKLDAVVTACDVTEHKPHPETFLKGVELLGLQPDQCVVFEDTELGKQAAHAGGMDCILVTEHGFELHPLER